jgi:hypothetical protein
MVRMALCSSIACEANCGAALFFSYACFCSAGKSSAIGADVVLRKCVGLVGGRGGGSAQFAQGILDAGKNGATRSDGWEGECFAALCEAARQAFGSETR